MKCPYRIITKITPLSDNAKPGEYFKPTDSDGSVGTVGTPINMER